MTYIIVKNYEHFNRSLPNWDSPKGKYIKNKKQYEEEMAKGGFKPYKETSPKESKWIPSEDLKRTLGDFKQMADRKGKIHLGSKAIEKMKSMGVSFNPKIMTNDLKGGIDDAV
jgi:hypothetical protein